MFICSAETNQEEHLHLKASQYVCTMSNSPFVLPAYPVYTPVAEDVPCLEGPLCSGEMMEWFWHILCRLTQIEDLVLMILNLVCKGKQTTKKP